MNYLNQNFVKFFKDLSKNNSTQWFNDNRKTYEAEVKKPFAQLVEEIIQRVQKLDPEVKIKASDAIMRINKDIRFSKDKTPYNTYVGAIVSPYGRKSKEFPGIYLQISADKVLVYGGAYMLEKDNLQKVRSYIAANLREFQKLVNDSAFKGHFGQILGDKNKVLPPEFKALVEKEPLIANKGFYFMAELGSKEVLSPKLCDTIMDYYKAGRPLNRFLIKALS
jgi:uncharacterized protein (TIGR02453 family)